MLMNRNVKFKLRSYHFPILVKTADRLIIQSENSNVQKHLIIVNLKSLYRASYLLGEVINSYGPVWSICLSHCIIISIKEGLQ